MTPAGQRKNKLVAKELKAGQGILSRIVKIRLRKSKGDQMNCVLEKKYNFK